MQVNGTSYACYQHMNRICLIDLVNLMHQIFMIISPFTVLVHASEMNC